MDSTTAGTLDEELKRLELETRRADLKQRKWEFLFKLAGLLTLVFGIAWPLYQYTTTLEREREDRKERQIKDEEQKTKDAQAALREARKPFLERQRTLYFEATTVASKLSTLAEGAERETARKRFYELYWGELSAVEDTQVESAMVKFKQALEDYESERTGNRSASRSELELASYNLAHSCRDSLAREWGP